MGQFDKLRSPKIYNLRADPFERGSQSGEYFDWMAHRMFMLVPAQAVVAQWLESFKDFPPRAKAAYFTVGDGEDHNGESQQELTGSRLDLTRKRQNRRLARDRRCLLCA
jgi:hypothetical protein